MNINGNTILVTGGNSGIGQALAAALHAKGNRVVITGRRQDALDETTQRHPGMESMLLDVSDADAVKTFASEVTRRFPSLNVVINNAGIMTPEDLVGHSDDLAIAEATIETNLLGPIRLLAGLSAHLQRQPAATIINSSSGLAFVPIAMTPTYCATKAAIHSYTQSLRHQLRDTSVEVIELVPPAVQTDLMPGLKANPRAMPLEEFVEEVLRLLSSQPTPSELCVRQVGFLRNAEANGAFDSTFAMLNAAH